MKFGGHPQGNRVPGRKNGHSLRRIAYFSILKRHPLDQLTVRHYRPDDADRWNAFIREARNATFLFDRGFMDYHQDRFRDASLIVEAEGKWMATLPANRVGDTVFSHQGLTYGGLLCDRKLRLAETVAVFAAVLRFLEREGVRSLQVKCIPHLYHDKPSQDMEYALFLSQAELIRRDALSAVDLGEPLRLYDNRREGVRRGEKNGLMLREETDPGTFWREILEPNLEARFGTRPVHSEAEIRLLMGRFPENIRQFNVYDNDRLVAGTTLFISRHVVHSQYIAADQGRNRLGSLDLLHHELLTRFAGQKRWFDFGTSNEQGGTRLNDGLSYWKESFGAGTVAHDFYTVDTANHRFADHFLL